MRKLSLLIFISLCMMFITNYLLAQDEDYMALVTTSPITIDGDLSEWALAEGIYLDEWEENGGTSSGPDDISVTFYVIWNDDNLYFAAEVTDDEHLQENVGDQIWNGDSVQIAIEPTGGRLSGGFDNTSYEYNFGLSSSGDVVLSRLYGHPEGWPSMGVDPFRNDDELMVVRDDVNKKTYYELRIPAEDIAPAEFLVGGAIGFAMICNDGDKDAPGQTGWVGWGSLAIVNGKDNAEMNLVTFSGEKLSVSPREKMTATWGRIKAR
jgi:hypothetical protein